MPYPVPASPEMESEVGLGYILVRKAIRSPGKKRLHVVETPELSQERLMIHFPSIQLLSLLAETVM